MWKSNKKRNSGKALSLDTPVYSVPSDRGNKYLKKTIGELKVGDIICGGDGKPTEVIHLNPIIIEDVYEVEFEDGEIIECNAEHLWVVKKKEIMELVETSYLWKLLYMFLLSNTWIWN